MRVVAPAALLLLVSACGRLAPSSDDARSGGSPKNDPPATAATARAPAPTPSDAEAPLFYSTLHVGADRSSTNGDEVRAHVEVRAYDPIKPGGLIPLGAGEQLTLNGVALLEQQGADGTVAYEAHVPEARDGNYQFNWIRPTKTVAFARLNAPRINVVVPATIHAGTLFDMTITPTVSDFGWDTTSPCAKPVDTGDFEHSRRENILTLVESPCQTEISVTSGTNWDVAFVDPANNDVVIDRGHASVDVLRSAWQAVSVVP